MPHIAGIETTYDHAKVSDEHFHSQARVYPTLANGVTVLAAGGVWTLGNFVEVIPANTIAFDIDMHFVTIEAASSAGVYELVLYAVEVEIARRRVAFIDIANSQTLPSIPFQSIILPKNTQIQAKLANQAGGGESLTVSIAWHPY